MILTLVSSDKLTLAMFSDFYKRIYSPYIKMVDINCLYSRQIVDSSLKDVRALSLKGKDILIKFKIKINTIDITPSIVENSDTIIKFDLFSMEPIIVKHSMTDIESIIDRWKKNINFLNKS
jgi:hypothetical protein